MHVNGSVLPFAPGHAADVEGQQHLIRAVSITGHQNVTTADQTHHLQPGSLPLPTHRPLIHTAGHLQLEGDSVQILAKGGKVRVQDMVAGGASGFNGRKTLHKNPSQKKHTAKPPVAGMSAGWRVCKCLCKMRGQSCGRDAAGVPP